MPSQINIKKAVVFALLSTMSLSIMALFVKLAAPYTNNNMTIFFRFAMSFIYIVIVLTIKKSQGCQLRYKTEHIWLHLIRSSMGVLSMMLFYYSLRYITLVDGSLLMMTNGLFIPILILIIYGKKTTLGHWIAVSIGFIGVLLVLQPGSTIFHPASFIALSSGLTSALAIISLRVINKYDPPHLALLYYFVAAFIISGIISIFNWKTPDTHTLILLLCIGIFGTLYQEFLVRATRYASSNVVSSLMYTNILFSGLFGIIIWNEIPGIISIIGIVLVCSGGLLTINAAKK